MIRLAVDARELVQGTRTGIGRYLVQVLRAASQAGWRCMVYGDQHTRLPDSLRGLSLHQLAASSTLWWDQVTIPRRLMADRATVFLSPYYKGPLCSPCPTVLTIHDLMFLHHPEYRGSWLHLGRTVMGRLYAARASAIITDSEYSKRSIMELLGVPAPNIRVIPLAPDPAFEPRPISESLVVRHSLTTPYILYVGNFKPHKNLPGLFKAYAELDQHLRNSVQLALVGADQARRQDLQRLTSLLGISGRVRFLGLVDDQELAVLYSNAAVVVLPSFVEGFGLPALEAMRCGAAVAASNRAAIPEVVGDGAVLFDPEHIPSITSALTGILTQPDRRNQLKHRALTRASQFSSEQTTDRVLALLQEVARAQPRLSPKVSTVSPVDGSSVR